MLKSLKAVLFRIRKTELTRKSLEGIQHREKFNKGVGRVEKAKKKKKKEKTDKEIMQRLTKTESH